MCCSVLQRAPFATACPSDSCMLFLVCCSVLQCAAECCSVLQCVVLCCSLLPHATSTRSVCCSMLQYMSVCCVGLLLSNTHSTRRAAAPHNTLTYQLSDAHSVCYVGLQLCESSARRRAAAPHNALSWRWRAAAWGCSSASLRVEWVLESCSACSRRRRAAELQPHTTHRLGVGELQPF